jgi:flagellar hook-length control protein FliK
MVQNVSVNTPIVAPKTNDAPSKEATNFNNVLKTKLDNSDSKNDAVDQRSELQNQTNQKLQSKSKDGVVLDEVLSTATQIDDTKSQSNEAINLEGILNSLKALIDAMNINPNTENIANANQAVETVGKIVLDIQAILNSDANSVQLQATKDNLSKLKAKLTEMTQLLNSNSLNTTDNSKNLLELMSLLNELGINIKDLNHNATNNKAEAVVSQISPKTDTTQVQIIEQGKVATNQQSNALPAEANQIGNEQDKNVIPSATVKVNQSSEQGVSSKNTNASDLGEIQALVSDIKKQINDLLEASRGTLNSDGVKEAKSESNIIDLSAATKFKFNSDSSKEKSTDGNQKEVVTKENQILKSLIKDKEDTPVNRFTLLTNNSTIGNQAVIKTTVPVINKETVVADVIKTVKYMVTDGVKELAVKINPKELGQVIITLVQEDGAIKASIKATSKDTYNMLAQNLNEMKKSLAEQNIKVQAVDISLNQETNNYNEGSFSNGTFQNRNSNNRFHQNGRSSTQIGSVEELEEEYVSEEIGNLNMLV